MALAFSCRVFRWIKECGVSLSLGELGIDTLRRTAQMRLIMQAGSGGEKGGRRETLWDVRELPLCAPHQYLGRRPAIPARTGKGVEGNKQLCYVDRVSDSGHCVSDCYRFEAGFPDHRGQGGGPGSMHKSFPRSDRAPPRIHREHGDDMDSITGLGQCLFVNGNPNHVIIGRVEFCPVSACTPG